MLSRSYASRKICPKRTPLRPLDYARLSTYGHSLDARLEQLREAGCTKIYREKVTGARPDRVLQNTGRLGRGRRRKLGNACPLQRRAQARDRHEDLTLLTHGGGLPALPGATRTAKRGHGAASPDH